MFSRFVFVYSENKVKISVQNVEFCIFNPSACNSETKNEGEKILKDIFVWRLAVTLEQCYSAWGTPKSGGYAKTC
jgi:hypothetical protein